MPELPEVETTRRGIAPHLIGHCVDKVIVRDGRLRWPVPRNLNSLLKGQEITAVSRRGKYLLLITLHGTTIIHLGMSGSLRVLDTDTPAVKHDHVDICLDTGKCLRLHDPRRFGCVLFTRDEPLQHELLNELGPEPLEADFTVDYLFEHSRRRKAAVKLFIMDSHIVVGVGNIYASEALFLAGIRPSRPAGRVTRAEYIKLVEAIKRVLTAAIKAGGTTLRDFTASDGRPGYFSQQLNVYGRKDEPCRVCGQTIKHSILGQRATHFCPHCQH